MNSLYHFSSLGIFFADGPDWLEQKRFAFRHLRDVGMAKSDTESFIHGEVESLLNQLKKKTVLQETIEVPEAFGIHTTNVILYLFTGIRFTEKDETKLKQGIEFATGFQKSGNATGSLVGIAPWTRFISSELSGFTNFKTSAIGMQTFIKVFPFHIPY